MDLKGSITYDATVDAVIAMLRDPEVTRDLYESLGHRDVEVLECGENDGVLRIRSSQVVDVDLPGFAKRVLKPTNTMVQTDEWRKGAKGAWNGTFDVEVKGAPIHISGTMRLAPVVEVQARDRHRRQRQGPPRRRQDRRVGRQG